jgi:hypothetical protein
MFRRTFVIDPRSSAARAAALLAIGAYALHELRYALAFGDAAPHVLDEHGHSYMGAIVPVLGLVVALGLGSWVTALLHAHRTARGENERGGIVKPWLAASASLMAVFSVQETLEGVLSPGHPSGVAAILGQGGWTSAPLALAIGLALVLLLRGARAATRHVATAHKGESAWRWLVVPAPLPSRTFADAATRPRLGALARQAAERAPPIAS